MLGDDKLSETLLKQVIAMKPEESAPYYDLSRLAAKVNNKEKAAEYIKKAIELDGKNKWYREQYANVLVLQNDYTGAADEYAAIAKTEKFNEAYLEKSAMLYHRAGKYKDALAQLEILKNKSHDNTDVLLQQQQVYLKMNDVAGAARVTRELIERNPKDSRFYTLLIDIYENNKMPEKAKEALAEMKQRFPTDPSLQLALANQALKAGDTATYNGYIRKTITNKELDAETQLTLLGPYLGALSGDSQQRTEALVLIEQLVLQHPENVDVLVAYGRILNFNNQPAKAAQQYQKAIAINPNNFNTWDRLLFSLTGPRDADSLIRWSEKAARLFPNQAIVHYYNGIGHYNKKEYKIAIRSLTRALDLAPEEKVEVLTNIYTTLGDIYNITKEYALSDSSYNAALQLDPRNETALNNYAYYLSLRNVRLDDAARMSKESLKIRPGEPTFLDTYGWILYQQGKYREALEYIQKAVDANPDGADPTLWEHLGAVQYRIGDKDGAIISWKKAREKGSENVNIDKMIAERKLYE
jgi:tetratricopeptide (TPR) repeat protein